jgi:hypothetical protein
VRAKAKLHGAASSAQVDYTAEQFATVACMILDGNGACSKEAAEARLGSITAAEGADKHRAGQAILHALQAANAITINEWWPSTTEVGATLPLSSTAELGHVVTAPNAFDLYCWQQMEGELRGAIKAAQRVSELVDGNRSCMGACTSSGLLVRSIRQAAVEAHACVQYVVGMYAPQECAWSQHAHAFIAGVSAMPRADSEGVGIESHVQPLLAVD